MEPQGLFDFIHGPMVMVCETGEKMLRRQTQLHRFVQFKTTIKEQQETLAAIMLLSSLYPNLRGRFIEDSNLIPLTATKRLDDAGDLKNLFSND